MLTLTEKQLGFCEAVAMGKNATDAYQQAFKSNSPGNCRVNASKLLKTPKIAEKIRELKKDNKEISKSAKTIAAVQIEIGRIATAAERMELLTKIYYGEVKIPKTEIKWNPKKKKFDFIELLELPGHGVRVAAINEHNKMDGSHATKQLEVKGIPPPSTQISDDQFDKLLKAACETKARSSK